MEIKVYGYRGCSTCRKAYALLGAMNLPFQEVDITLQAPTMPELQGMLTAVQGQVKKLFNTSGQVYREQNIGAKLEATSAGEALALLEKNGRLVKRPFLIIDGRARAVGFKEEVWRELLG